MIIYFKNYISLLAFRLLQCFSKYESKEDFLHHSGTERDEKAKNLLTRQLKIFEQVFKDEELAMRVEKPEPNRISFVNFFYVDSQQNILLQLKLFHYLMSSHVSILVT